MSERELEGIWRKLLDELNTDCNCPGGFDNAYAADSAYRTKHNETCKFRRILNEAYDAGCAAQSQKAPELELVDHATGVKGTYCIGRKEGAYMSFWNPEGWAGSGYVFTDKRIAESVMAGLAVSTGPQEKEGAEQ